MNDKEISIQVDEFLRNSGNIVKVQKNGEYGRLRWHAHGYRGFFVTG
jgi:hypothetical protein